MTERLQFTMAEYARQVKAAKTLGVSCEEWLAGATTETTPPEVIEELRMCWQVEN